MDQPSGVGSAAASTRRWRRLAGLASSVATVLVLMPLTGRTEDAAQSRLAIIGTADVVLYGQAGYCGSMTSFDKGNTGGVLIAAGQRTWVRLRHQRDCVGDFSFVPAPGRAYILRAGTDRANCLAEFFLVHPGQAPSRVKLDTEGRRSCLFPGNHESAPSAPPTGSEGGLPTPP